MEGLEPGYQKDDDYNVIIFDYSSPVLSPLSLRLFELPANE
jgi:hypothetical protein